MSVLNDSEKKVVVLNEEYHSRRGSLTLMNTSTNQTNTCKF
jgi:hypothetical protein